MKIKNKKTGAVYRIEDIDLGNNADGIWLGMTKYNSLAELNAEWEDAPEEPKGYWCITQYGNIVHRAKQIPIDDYDPEAEHKEIGNYFGTKEDTEKAVEKLKAWKRLKDEYDFKFTGWKRDEQYRGDFIITAQDWNTSDDKLLDLLFGGE